MALECVAPLALLLLLAEVLDGDPALDGSDGVPGGKEGRIGGELEENERERENVCVRKRLCVCVRKSL